MTGYYDLVLVMIPAALLGIGSLLTVAGFGLFVAASVGGAAAVALVGHAIFVRGPVPTTRPQAQQTATDGGSRERTGTLNAN